MKYFPEQHVKWTVTNESEDKEDVISPPHIL